MSQLDRADRQVGDVEAKKTGAAEDVNVGKDGLPLVPRNQAAMPGRNPVAAHVALDVEIGRWLEKNLDPVISR